MNRKITKARAALGAAAAAVAIAGCGGAAATHTGAAPSAAHSTAASPNSPAIPAQSYPAQAADAALCKTYNADISSGDLLGIETAAGQAAGTVSAKLARDILASANGTSLQQDLKLQVKVAEDCALVHVGVSP